jgi:hypothetical protein
VEQAAGCGNGTPAGGGSYTTYDTLQTAVAGRHGGRGGLDLDGLPVLP